MMAKAIPQQSFSLRVSKASTGGALFGRSHSLTKTIGAR